MHQNLQLNRGSRADHRQSGPNCLKLGRQGIDWPARGKQQDPCSRAGKIFYFQINTTFPEAFICPQLCLLVLTPCLAALAPGTLQRRGRKRHGGCCSLVHSDPLAQGGLAVLRPLLPDGMLGGTGQPPAIGGHGKRGGLGNKGVLGLGQNYQSGE